MNHRTLHPIECDQEPAELGIQVAEYWIESEAARRVPFRLWQPSGNGPFPLAMVGHGGSGHKNSSLVRDVAIPWAQKGIAVVAIDGPVHGARRAPANHGTDVRQEFRMHWAAGNSIAAMVEDWTAVYETVSAMPTIKGAAAAWYGISMGTAYGLPFAATRPLLRAAVIGMWGTCRVGSQSLPDAASRLICPVLFQRQADDPLFTVQGQEEIYNRITSNDCMLRVYDGKHTDPSGHQLNDILDFVARHLKA